MDLPTPGRPEHLNAKDLSKLAVGEKLAYDDARLHYAANMPPIVKLMEKAHEELWLLTRLNNHRAYGPHPGLIVDGDPGNGKTTLITEFGRDYDALQRKIHPGETTEHGAEFLPTAFMSIDSTPTVKGFTQRFLEFYGISTRYATAGELTSLAIRLVHECQTSLILIDEIHYLNLNRDSHREVNNHLKHLANDMNATFVYAGVGLEKRKFMLEGLGDEDEQLSQISRRFKRIPAEPLKMFRQEDRELMMGILDVYERELPLARSREGDLISLATYIWDRTQGVIGTISGFITEAYSRAVLTETERITKPLFESMTIAQGAEVAHARQKGNQKLAA